MVYMSFLYLVLLIAGIFMVYSAAKLKRTGHVDGNTFWSTAYPLSQCKDLDGFIKYMFPRMVICGIVLTLDGCIGLITDQFQVLAIMPYISMAVTVFIMVWYYLLTRKAEKVFF